MTTRLGVALAAALLTQFLVVGRADGQALAPFRAPITYPAVQSTSEVHHHTVAAIARGGDAIAAIHFDGRVEVSGHIAHTNGHSSSVVLARIGRDGTVRWIRRFAEEVAPRAPHIEAILHVAALSDGGVIIGAMHGTPSSANGVLARLDAGGREVWRLSPTEPGDSGSLMPIVGPGDRVIVSGGFNRGPYRLPGMPRWSPRGTWHGFLAEVDPASGRPIWARLTLGGQTSVQLADDGSLVVLGGYEGSVRFGAQTSHDRGAGDLYVARLDSSGTPLAHFTWGTQHSDSSGGLHVFTDGTIAVLAITRELRGPHRFVEVPRMIGFAPDGRELWSERLPRRFVVMTSGPTDGDATIVVPGVEERLFVRRADQIVTERLQLLTYGARGALSTREVIAPPLRSLSMSLRAVEDSSGSGDIVVSGALAEPRDGAAERSESFHVRAPRAPASVAHIRSP